MLHLMMVFVPAVGICGLIWKLPENVKDKFFSVPTWITSTTCSFLLKFFLHGVMASYGVILADLFLYPVFTGWKHYRKLKKERITQRATNLKIIPREIIYT